jgi:hypothetical protein
VFFNAPSYCNNRVRTTFGFRTVAALGGRSVDPLLAAKSLFYNIIEFHLIGNEGLDKVFERCATTDLLSNTPLIGWSDGTTFKLCGAALRYRPNGTPILCAECQNPGDFVKFAERSQLVRFRCRNVLHGPLYWCVSLLQSDDCRKVVGGLNARCRYILTKSYD